MIVSADTPDGINQFRIYDIKNKSTVVEVTAVQLMYDFDNKEVNPFSIKNATGSQVISRFKSSFKSTLGQFTMDSSVAETHDFATNDEDDDTSSHNALEVLNRITNRWDSELMLNGFDIRMIKRLGAKTDALLYEKKNISEFEDASSVSGMITRIHATSKFTPEGKEDEVILSVTVDSPLINEYAQIYEKSYVNNDCRTEAELIAWTKLKYSTENVDKPSRSITVSTNIIDGTEINYGDDLVLKYLVHDVDEIIRCVGYDYDPIKNTYYSVTLGDWKDSFATTLTGGIVDKTNQQLNQLKNNITYISMSANGKNRNAYGPEPVPNPINGDNWYYYEFDRPNDVELRIFQDGFWVAIDFATKKEVKAVLDQADFDRAKAEQEINQALIDAKNYTEIKAQEFDNQLLIVNQNVLIATNSANAAVLKADKAIEDVGFMKLDVAQIKSDASTALSTANTAKTNAQTAMANALTAISRADTAISTTGNLSLIVDDLEKSITFKADSSRVDTISGKVDNQAIQIKANADGLVFKADKSLVDTVKGTVDQHTLDIAATNRGLTFKADSSRVDTIKGTVDSHTTELGIQSQAITARLTSAQVDSLVTGKGYVNQAQLTATSSQWNLSLTQVSSDLSNISVGGTNLIPYTKNNGNVTEKFGEFSVMYGVAPASGTKDTYNVKTPLLNELEYVVSFYAKSTSTNSYIENFFYSPNTTTYAKSSTGGGGTANDGRATITGLTNEWKRYWITWKQSSSGVAKTLIIGRVSNGNNVSIAGLKFETGNKASDWSPAPEDMATLDQFTTLDIKVTGIQTTVGNKADQSQVTQLANQWTQTTNLANGHTGQIANLGTDINLRVTKADLISQINVQADNILIQTGKLYLDVGSVTMSTAFVTDLNTKTLTAVTANIATIRSQLLIANVIDSTMINANTALITKLFATDANVQILTAKTAFINSVKAIDIAADRITTGNLNAGNVNIINLNVSKIVGLNSNFIQSEWNKVNSTLSIDGTALQINNAGQNDKAMLQKGGMTFYFSGTEVGRVGLNYSQQSTESYLSFSARNGQGMNWAVETGANTGVYDTIMEVPKGQKTLRMQKTLNLNSNSITEVASIYSPQHIISNGMTTSEIGKLYASGAIATLNANTQLNIQVGNVSKASVTTDSFNLHTGLNANGNSLLNMDTVYFGTNMEVRKVNANTLDVRSNTQLRLVVNGFTMLDVLRSSTTNTGVNMHANLNMMGNVVTGQSDRRLKKHIFNTSGDSLSAINRWIFVDYEWIDTNRPNGIKFGLIAQDTPELAIFDSLNDIYNIDYSKLSLINSHAIQQLNRKVVSINSLATATNSIANNAMNKVLQVDDEVQQMKNKISELEKEIKTLKGAA